MSAATESLKEAINEVRMECQTAMDRAIQKLASVMETAAKETLRGRVLATLDAVGGQLAEAPVLTLVARNGARPAMAIKKRAAGQRPCPVEENGAKCQGIASPRHGGLCTAHKDISEKQAELFKQHAKEPGGVWAIFNASRSGKKTSAGKKKTDAEMRCRAPGCKNRSKGPKFSYVCGEHWNSSTKTERKKWAADFAEKRAA